MLRGNKEAYESLELFAGYLGDLYRYLNGVYSY